MCYYNKDCPHHSLKLFIRIADCDKSFLFDFNVRQLKTCVNFIDGVLSVLSGHKRSYTYLIYRFSLAEAFDREPKYQTAKFTVRANMLEGYRYVTLHADAYTCSEPEWLNKKNIIISELEQFKQFLCHLRSTKAV